MASGRLALELRLAGLKTIGRRLNEEVAAVLPQPRHRAFDEIHRRPGYEKWRAQIERNSTTHQSRTGQRSKRSELPTEKQNGTTKHATCSCFEEDS